jgi:hypothetical protein
MIARFISRLVLNKARRKSRLRLGVIASVGGVADAAARASGDADKGAGCLRKPISGTGWRGLVGGSKRCFSRFKK